MPTLLPSKVGRFCTGRYLEICAASLDANSSTSPLDQENGDALNDIFSTSSSGSSIFDASVELDINATALNALVLNPVGGVSAAGGHLVINDVRR